MSPPTRIGYLDGLRALGILAVLGVHWGAQYLPVGTGGYIGVDIFFVVSGYIITTMLWRSPEVGTAAQRWRTFIARRARRLYPALLGLAAISPLAVALAPGAQTTAAEAAENAGLAVVQMTWLPELLGHTTEPFRQTWSLAMEWYFYLLWPLAVFAAKRHGWSPTRFARLTGGTAVVLYLLALPWGARVFYVTPPARFAEILAGAVLALSIAGRSEAPRRVVPTWTAIVALAAICLYVLAAPGDYLSVSARLVGVPLAVGGTLLLLLHGQREDHTSVKRLLCAPPVTLLGRCSYSLYLWHWLPVYVLNKDAVDLPPLVLGVIGVGMAAIATALSYRYLELPFLSSQSAALRPERDRAPATA